MVTDEQSDMLSVKEVTQMLHIHANTLRRWSDRGQLPSYRIGPRGDRRFRREDISRFLDELTSGAKKEDSSRILR